MHTHKVYMHRCIELARLGAGHVVPNPMVGAVLVHEGRIIGEGYHQQYGRAHAEVNCINSVNEADRHLIPSSTIYVSLEPCAHFGKTPPCADLIIDNRIEKVVIGCRDPFKQVNGKGIEKLKRAGVKVVTGVLENECRNLNKRFFTFHTQRRPYIILKWAQSKNGKIANANRTRVLISNEYTNRLVHRWRSEEAAIMVGTNTALHDDPSLNTRLATGPDPIRLVVDMNLRLPGYLQVFNEQQRTIIFNKIKHKEEGIVQYYQVTEDVSIVDQVLNACYHLNIQSILVEGGALLLQTFIEQNAWDEARIIENDRMVIPEGLPAPLLVNQQLNHVERILTDSIYYYTRAV